MAPTRSATPPAGAEALKGRWRDDPIGAFAAVFVVLAVAVIVTAVAFIRVRDGPDASSSSGGFTGADFHSFVADPRTPEQLFVGGHQAVSVSADGGASWTRLEALDNVDAMGWGFGAADVWIGGHPGVAVWPDGGEADALGAGHDVIYAAGPNIGVIESRDDGATWQHLTTSNGQSFVGRILVDPDDPQQLLAADAARGPVASDDGGRTWNVLTTLPVKWISASDDLETIYASGPDGAVGSDDAGATWEPLNQPFAGSLIEADPHEPGRLYAGLHDGATVTVFISDDRGPSWRRA